ncbi:MAG: hypothetical protein ICV59_09100 [Thermoleophilia bacterium]|nr:hypothetical protein [Thermoleophilia bacterium]
MHSVNSLMSRVVALLVTAAVALVAISVAPASTDLRSPDARPGALGGEEAVVVPSLAGRDLRSPDARPGALGGEEAVVVSSLARRDLRSPDARPGALAYTTIVRANTARASDRFDWSDAGVGAATALFAVLLAGGLGAALVRHNRMQPSERLAGP